MLMVPVVLTELLSDPELPSEVGGTLSEVPMIDIEPGYWPRAGALDRYGLLPSTVTGIRALVTYVTTLGSRRAVRCRPASNRIGSPGVSSPNQPCRLDGIVCVLEYEMAFLPLSGPADSGLG